MTGEQPQLQFRQGIWTDDDAMSRASPAVPWKADIPPDVQNLRIPFQIQDIEKSKYFLCKTPVRNFSLILRLGRDRGDHASRQNQKFNSPASERRPAVTDSFARDRLLSFAATWI